MARLAGVNIPDNKHAVISLTYIFGIGRTTANKLCTEVGVNPTEKIKDLTEAQLDSLRSEISKLSVEGDLRRENQLNVKRLLDFIFILKPPVAPVYLYNTDQSSEDLKELAQSIIRVTFTDNIVYIKPNKPFLPFM